MLLSGRWHNCSDLVLIFNNYFYRNTTILILDQLTVTLFKVYHKNEMQLVATTPLEPSRKLVYATNQGTHAPATSERSGTTIRAVPDQSMPRVRTVADQSDLRIRPGLGALEDTSLVGFPRRTSPAGLASLSFRCPQLSPTPTCWLLLIHSLFPSNAYLFSLWGTACARDDRSILPEISVPRYIVQ